MSTVIQLCRKSRFLTSPNRDNLIFRVRNESPGLGVVYVAEYIYRSFIIEVWLITITWFSGIIEAIQIVKKVFGKIIMLDYILSVIIET